jgi:hypothetical protein
MSNRETIYKPFIFGWWWWWWGPIVISCILFWFSERSTISYVMISFYEAQHETSGSPVTLGFNQQDGNTGQCFFKVHKIMSYKGPFIHCFAVWRGIFSSMFSVYLSPL